MVKIRPFAGGKDGTEDCWISASVCPTPLAALTELKALRGLVTLVRMKDKWYSAYVCLIVAETGVNTRPGCEIRTAQSIAGTSLGARKNPVP